MNGVLKIFVKVSVFIFVVSLCVSSPCFSADTTKAPSVFFPQPLFEFDKMVEGEDLLHDFVIMNKGTDILKVEKVKTTCGCTTVSYSKEIPPNGEGKITMKVNTRGYGGRKLTKAIGVITNDSRNPESILTVSGNIEKFATITPQVVRLNGKIGDELKSVIKIVPEPNYPFSIAKIKAQEGKNIKYEFREDKSVSESQSASTSQNMGKTYSVIVENIKKDAGFYYDVLIIETNSKIQPEIKINVMGRILDPDAQDKTPLSRAGVNGNNGTNLQQDPKNKEDLKKKFEALIKQAQEKRKTQEQQKADGQPKKE